MQFETLLFIFVVQEFSEYYYVIIQHIYYHIYQIINSIILDKLKKKQIKIWESFVIIWSIDVINQLQISFWNDFLLILTVQKDYCKEDPKIFINSK